MVIDANRLARIQEGSKPSFAAGKLAGNPWIPLTGCVDCARECLEQDFNHVVRLFPIKKLQMKIAPGFIGESLKKLTGQTKPERG